VAERERLTNKERRAQGREERKRKEAAAAAKARRDRLRNRAITSVVASLVGVVVFQAVRPDPRSLDEAILVNVEEAEEAQDDAECELIAEREPLSESFHFEASVAPEADTVYTGVRPTHSGPHNAQVSPASLDGFSRQIDERSSTHNLEHGAVIVWYDPTGTDGDQIAAWAEVLNVNGFGEAATRSSAAILTSPYEEPGISSGKAVAFRAWGTAMDCERFDETAANAFVARHFGSRGIGPEGSMVGYPERTLEFSDVDVAETSTDGSSLESDPGTATDAEGS